LIELFRRTQNPWGQDVLIGISWDLMWLAIVLAALFLVGHAIWYRVRGFSAHESGGAAAVPPGVPERIQRHSLAARLFHWTMAAAMLTLLFSAFVPIMDLEFDGWLTIHWIAGVVLIATIVYHIIHAIGWQDFWSMMSFGPNFFKEGIATLKHVLSKNAPEPPKAGKYPFDHRLYHHTIVVVSLAAMITGVMMMMRIDTPFFTRDPYFISDEAVGIVFAIHGFAGVSLILLIATHIYFAIRPEKRWITWSMIRGWVDREHYAEHFDPSKWVVTGERGPAVGGAVAEPSVSAPVQDD
jgi:cytochrome b subunit of formate dehydrogenase